MNDDFKKAVGKISIDLRRITASGDWEEDLEVALESIDLSQEDIDVIKKISTPTLFNDINDADGNVLTKSIEQRLMHAFKDPAVKSGMMFEHASLGAFNDKDMMRLLIESRNALKDIVYNYKKILGEEMPGSVADIISDYEQNTINLNDQIDKLSEQSGINPDNIVPKGDGWEHISRLPEDAFTNE